MLNNFFFPPRKLCLLCDNVEKYGIARQARDDNIIQLTRFVWWITKTTGTNAEYVILIEFLRHLHVTFTPTLPVLFKRWTFTEQITKDIIFTSQTSKRN